MKLFVTGISTEVGKTLVSSILVEALQADYWKPVQAGDLDNSDSHKVAQWISNQKTVIHPNAYALHTPMSPHAAAERDGIEIDIEKIVEPKTNNHLVIEGAGGLLVPLNQTATILDLIKPDYKVVVVSRHYLGSINHSLLTLRAIEEKGIKTGIIFSGNQHPTTESIILNKTGVPFLGRIDEEETITKQVIKKYAAHFRRRLVSFGLS